METNKVVEMMDAIFEGKPFRMKIESANDNFENMEIRFREDNVVFVGKGDKFVCIVNESRVAREIAGALVTWANKRENVTMTGEQAHSSMTLFGWAEINNRHHPINQSRTKWYNRTVNLMTDETILRNISDMEKIAKHYAEEVVKGDDSNYGTLQDIRGALDVCHHEIRRRDTLRSERVSGSPAKIRRHNVEGDDV